MVGKLSKYLRVTKGRKERIKGRKKERRLKIPMGQQKHSDAYCLFWEKATIQLIGIKDKSGDKMDANTYAFLLPHKMCPGLMGMWIT